WAETEETWWWKGVAVLAITTGCTAHAELLLLPLLELRFRWVQTAAVGAIALLGLLWDALIVGDLRSDGLLRAILVAAIAAALATLAVPLRWRLGRAAANERLHLRRVRDEIWADAEGNHYTVRRVAAGAGE